MWELICLPDLKGEEESGGELDCGRSKKAGITFKKGDESQEDDDDYGEEKWIIDKERKRWVRGDETRDGVGARCPVLGEATGDEKGWREKGRRRVLREGEKAGTEEIEGKRKVTWGKNLGKQGVKGTMANSVKLTGRKKDIGFLRKVRN